MFISHSNLIRNIQQALRFAYSDLLCVYVRWFLMQCASIAAATTQRTCPFSLKVQWRSLTLSCCCCLLLLGTPCLPYMLFILMILDLLFQLIWVCIIYSVIVFLVHMCVIWHDFGDYIIYNNKHTHKVTKLCCVKSTSQKSPTCSIHTHTPTHIICASRTMCVCEVF